jgi:hypothetical protein
MQGALDINVVVRPIDCLIEEHGFRITTNDSSICAHGLASFQRDSIEVD